MSRRLPPSYEGRVFCSDECLRIFFECELSEKWRALQIDKPRAFPRPKLGTILMETAAVTRAQIDQAIKLQSQAQEGRIGEWLQKLGYVEEHQITEALSRQYGLPLIDLNKSRASADAARLVPGKIAKCSGLIPVGFDDSHSELRVAVSAPVDFNSQEAIRRMVHKGIVPYIGDQSAIQQLLEELYEPEDLDLSNVPTYGSLEDAIEIGNDLISAAIDYKAEGMQAELVPEFLWIRLDFPTMSHHHFFRFLVEHHEEIHQREIAVGYEAGQ
jgi:hypothetical protein